MMIGASQPGKKGPQKLFSYFGFTNYDDPHQREAFRQAKEKALRAVNMNHSIKFTDRVASEQETLLNAFVAAAQFYMQRRDL
jgi:hypothetical protein